MPRVDPGRRQPATQSVIATGSTTEEASRPSGAPVVRFATTAIAALLLLVIVYLTFVQTEPGQRVENLGLEGAALRSDADRADSLGQLSLVRLVPFIAVMVLVVLAASMRRRSVLGLVVVGSMAAAVVLTELLKGLLPRPPLVEGPAWLLRNSFPSGTTAVAAAVAIAILLVSPGRLRWLAMPAAALLAAVIGQATQIAGWHRMSDGIGAVLLVVAVGAGALTVLAAAGYVQPSSRGRISPRVRGTVTAAGAVAILLGVLVLLIGLAFPVLQAPSGAIEAFLHTSFDLVGAGATMLIVVALGVVVEPFSLGQAADARPVVAESSPVRPS